jgi:hypothetical protein
MEYLNLHVSVLDRPELVGAEPIDRATWLYLLRYCAGQENGGRILGCASWGDRRWQQIARVTLREVKRRTELWRWEGEDLVVHFYPSEQEAAVRAKRQAGRETAAKRWSKQDSSAPKNNSLATPELHAKGKIKEREGEGNARERADAPAPPGKKESEVEWLERLRREHPGVDIDAELAAARAKKRKEGRRLDRKYFEQQWLKNVGEPVSDGTKAAPPRAPDGWREWLVAHYPKCRFVTDGECVAERFAQLPEDVQAEAIAELRKAL